MNVQLEAREDLDIIPAHAAGSSRIATHCAEYQPLRTCPHTGRPLRVLYGGTPRSLAAGATLLAGPRKRAFRQRSRLRYAPYEASKRRAPRTPRAAGRIDEEGTEYLRSQEDTDWLTSIRAQTRDILQHAIGDATEVAILDAPNQRNVGDSLIWEGELTYLQSLGLTVAYVSDLRGYDAEDVRKHLSPGAVVLLHGGGNFGDLWLGHQQLRERIVSELNDFRIVQLPQSILFRDEALAARANEVLSQHPDFRLLIRDSLSMQRAADQLPALTPQFCPDMALGFEPTSSRIGDETLDVLVIARDDHEAASGLSGIDATALSPLTIEVTDWWKHAKEPARWRSARSVARLHSLLLRARRKTRRVTGLPLPFPRVRQKRLKSALEIINRSNVEYAIALYSRADGVLVDRLHAHVLAALLGIEHVMLDNNYRKLGAVYDDYTHELSTARYSTDLDDAIEQIRGALNAR